MDAWCFKCNESTKVSEAEYVETPNHRHRISGKCTVCGGKVSKFIKQCEAEAHKPCDVADKKEEGECPDKKECDL